MNIDLKKLIRKYGGEWVALDEGLGKVLVSGKKAKDVYDKAQEKSSGVPYLFKVPTRLVAYIGLNG